MKSFFFFLRQKMKSTEREGTRIIEDEIKT